MKRELFDIWEDASNSSGSYHWRVQLVNYVGSFASRESAESFIEATKKARAEDTETFMIAAAPTKKSK